MHGDVAMAQRSEREDLSVVGRASVPEYVSQQRGQLEVFLFRALLEQPHLVDVLYAEHSRVTGLGLRGSIPC